MTEVNRRLLEAVQRNDLYSFLRSGFPFVCGGAQMLPNWHLEAVTHRLEMVREGRVAEGRGWIGLADREAYQLRDIRQVGLAPGWLMLLLAGGLAFAAWRVEGR